MNHDQVFLAVNVLAILSLSVYPALSVANRVNGRVQNKGFCVFIGTFGFVMYALFVGITRLP